VTHLGTFRKGWENEHLASFLLSRISFVANPITVADDIGSDFFCTLFEAKEGAHLLPRNSFAIQIKSSKSAFEVTNKIEYLEKLELPFFVGVADQSKLMLSVYSGEWLPILFSYYGIPQVLRLSPDDNRTGDDNYCEKKSAEEYTLRMPFVLDLNAQDDRRSVAAKGLELLQLCSRMHQNISSRVGGEYIFKLSEPRKVVIMAGIGSSQTFRNNFYFRLAEAFCNFEWLHRASPEQFPIAEYRAFEHCYRELKKTDQIPNVVEEMYQRINQRLASTPRP